ncbi:MAG: DMT family transporter [Prevotellaceae bacterium]|jgi:drug/metabolite transporter (DMT)-like permease|nr:DMT family transporter [Prevotellaceae bacterium]
MKQQNNTGTYLGVIFSTILWGLSFVWTNQLLRDGFPMYSLLILRLVIAAVLLLIVTLFTGKFNKIQYSDFKWFLLLVLCEPFFYFIGETYGILYTDSASISSLIVATLPIFTMTTAYLIYKERFSKINIFGVMFALFGVAISLLNEDMKFTVHPFGITMLLLALLSATGYSLVIKKLSERYNPITIVIVQNFAGALLFVPFGLFETTQLANFHFSFASLYPLILLAIFPSALAFLTYIHAVKRIGVAKASMFCTVIPIVTLLFAAMIGQDKLYQRNIIGVIIVVFGLVLSQMRKRD